MKCVVFTQRVEIIESYNERRDCADQRISEFIWKCGFTPIPLPNDPAKANSIICLVNPLGIILTGGNSLEKYGGDAPERDSTDYFLIKKAIEDNVPLYGFCRGMESILDYFGNSLENVSGHVAVRHVIRGNEGGREVNSYHNQACKELKSNALETVMRAEDDVIEKIRHVELPILGTMWHPERENPYSDKDVKMVRDLFGGGFVR